jgi:hypothetical protein
VEKQLILFKKALLNEPVEIVKDKVGVYETIDITMYNNFKKNNIVYSDKELMLFTK